MSFLNFLQWLVVDIHFAVRAKLASVRVVMRKLVLFVWTVYDIPHCYDDDYGQPYHVSIPRQVL